MKKLIITSFSIIALAFVGCNTVDGVGQDIERAGEKIQDSSN